MAAHSRDNGKSIWSGVCLRCGRAGDLDAAPGLADRILFYEQRLEALSLLSKPDAWQIRAIGLTTHRLEILRTGKAVAT